MVSREGRQSRGDRAALCEFELPAPPGCQGDPLLHALAAVVCAGDVGVVDVIERKVDYGLLEAVVLR